MFNKLTSQIFIAIIVGIVVGFLANISAESSSLVYLSMVLIGYNRSVKFSFDC